MIVQPCLLGVQSGSGSDTLLYHLLSQEAHTDSGITSATKLNAP